MDFTREPIIETVVTPKEGCKLVVRSSKGTGQEEYFVDALEVVAFGNAIFYRSLERPKSFLVPASDYEVLEVREARMVLKNVGLDRSIKIGGGRDASKTPKEVVQEKASTIEEEVLPSPSGEETSENKENRKRDRRRQSRRKRNAPAAEGEELSSPSEISNEILADGDNISPEPPTQTGATLASILPPPPMLISETIGRYKDNALFKGAFYTKEEEPIEPISDVPPVALVQPEYGSFDMSIEEEEEVYLQRTQQQPQPKEFLQETDDLIPSSRREEETFPEKDYSIPKEQDPS